MFTLKSRKGLGSHLKFSVYEVKAKKLLVKNEAKEIALKVFYTSDLSLGLSWKFSLVNPSISFSSEDGILWSE